MNARLTTVPSSASADQRLLVAGDGPGLGGGDEPGADPDAVGAEGQRGGEPPTVEDPAGGDDRDPVPDGVDDLGDERHRRHRPGVAAGLGALGDDEVAAGFDRGDGVAHLAAHVDDEHVAVVAALDHVAGHAEGGDEHRHALGDEQVDALEHLVGQRGEQVDPERPVGERLRGPDLLAPSARGSSRQPRGSPKPAGLGHRGDEPVIGDAAHAGEHHRVLDLEHSTGRMLSTSLSLRPGASSRERRGGVNLSAASAADWPTSGTPAHPLVGVIMGSDSDLPVMQAAVDVLTQFEVPHEVRVVSAHRTPDWLTEYARGRRSPGPAGDHRRRRRRRPPARV